MSRSSQSDLCCSEELTQETFVALLRAAPRYGDPDFGGSLQASLRIPVSELESAIAELKARGHVERESQSSEEVTMQHADLDARISNARETELRLKQPDYQFDRGFAGVGVAGEVWRRWRTLRARFMAA